MAKFKISSLRTVRQWPTLTKDNRVSFFSNDWKSSRPKFVRPVIGGGVMFMLLFLGACSYFYGTLYHSNYRYDNFRVLAVDYDGGVIGRSLQAAYQQLEGPHFFNLEFRSPSEYPSDDNVLHAVWEGKYWAAIFATEGASERLGAAIQGDNADRYNPAEALHYIWNGQYYPVFSTSVVKANIQTLVAATRIAYNRINGTGASAMLDQRNPAAVQALLNPIAATERNIKDASYSAAVLYGTIGSVTPVLSQFFFLLLLNGMFLEYQLYTQVTVGSSLVVRLGAGIFYSLGSALVQAGYWWAFGEDWDVNGAQFILTWLVLWVLMMDHQLLLETAFLLVPLPATPFIMLIWMFMNIPSTLSPLELQAGFFHWAMAIPGYNAYATLVTIWTGGARNRLYRTLPILFAWLVAGLIGTTLAHWRACHLAFKRQRVDVLERRDDKSGEAGQPAEGVMVSNQPAV
ncbi:uncharacterized protein EI97DRAFT_433994 [Westerdykella ornata]|uniref:DUF3533 domain-containing protein n=1 Tax=Westerdykella ornata TaxID=318751 RepID=A0A6A6JGM9_WESOR|nr:uncharacterized protein EI97DRAFT_433994 [Westerdykella ornata]KAF2275582.1 hypothetical protein EI97DRAFT_433994 [Westerdykella ornata]